MREGFFTFWGILAHSVPVHLTIVVLRLHFRFTLFKRGTKLSSSNFLNEDLKESHPSYSLTHHFTCPRKRDIEAKHV